MDEIEHEELPNAIVCPECDYVMDSVTGLDGVTTPDEGSVSVCMQCGKISLFTVAEGGRLSLTTAPPEVERDVLQDPRIARLVQHIQGSEFQAHMLLSRLDSKD